MDELIESIYSDPDNWDLDGYTFRKGEINIWVSNGVFYVRPYEKGWKFTFMQKFRFWRAYKWWLKNCPQSKLTKVT